MGRPSKTTVDYFPHFTASGKTLYTLESIYGNDGYAFWFKVLELLGSTSGHYYQYSQKPDWLYLLAKTKVNPDQAVEMLSLLADLGAIDKELLSKKIIFSDNFLEHLRPVYGKRGTEIPCKPSFRGENEVSGPEMQQSKVKESKGKERKVFGTCANVKLTDDEYQKLTDKFNGTTEDRINRLSEYMASRGKTYKSHYATILAWSRKDKNDTGQDSSAGKPWAGAK